MIRRLKENDYRCYAIIYVQKLKSESPENNKIVTAQNLKELQIQS